MDPTWYPRITIAAILVLAVSLALCLGQDSQADLDFPRTGLAIETTQGLVAYTVEVATTPAQRRQGLQGRRTLATDAGMLLVYEPPVVASVWMKNTHLSLDILFIDAQGIITAIVPQTVPESLTPISSQKPVRAVLEIKGGSAARNGIQPGDRVIHPLFPEAGKQAQTLPRPDTKNGDRTRR